MAETSEQLRDIAYSSANPLHHFDLYLPPHPVAPDRSSPDPPPLFCFIHGGAWRSEDKSGHTALARRLADHTRCPVAVPNYRLTTPSTPHHLHPVHAQDILTFLHFILLWNGPNADDKPPYDPNKIFLIGHSCSAHMLASIYLSPPPPYTPVNLLIPSPALLQATRGFIFSEGIYDLDLLIRSFPTYRDWFVTNTFGSRDSLAEFNVASYALRPGGEHARWLILHAKGDPLVDVAQSQTFYTHLSQLYQAHDGAEDAVTLDIDHLKANGHNEIFQEDVYPELIAQFVLAHAISWKTRK